MSLSKKTDDELAFLELTALLSDAVGEFKLLQITPIWSSIKTLQSISKAIADVEKDYVYHPLSNAKDKINAQIALRTRVLEKAILALKDEPVM